jgi:hypothetical protein
MKSGFALINSKNRGSSVESSVCAQKVYKRDTYRRTGGPRKFKMHYTEQQCSRSPLADSRYCWQHAPWHRSTP